MIYIRIRKQDDGLLLRACGHAGAAPAGQDIVCAGVSMLLYGFIAYLKTLPPIATAEENGEFPHLELSEGDGFMSIVTRGLGGMDLMGLRVTEAGLRLMELAYPAYVRLDAEGGTSETSDTNAEKEKGEGYE